MENFYRDVRYGLRTLAKSPGFTIVAALILALGIGATTAIFTLVNGIFLKPMPVQDAEGLMSVYTTDEKNPGFRQVSGENYKDYRDENEVFSDLAAYTQLLYNMGSLDEPTQVLGELVTANYFDVLGVGPALGRLILPEEDQTPGTHPVAVLSHRAWENRFGSDPGVIGQEITVNGTPLTIIGVAEEGFDGLTLAISQEVWVPYMMFAQVHPTPDLVADRRAILFNVVGKLKPGVTREQAESNMQAIGTALAEQYPTPNEGRNVTLDPLSRLGPAFRSTLALAAGLLIAISGLVLAIASANIANLLLVRAAARRREIAVRLSLGAGRIRLIRQLLTESFVLAAIGGIGGLVLALWTRDLLWSLVPATPPVQLTLDASLDGRVIGFAALVSLAGGLFFGLVPAIQSSRPDLSTELKSGQQKEGSIRRFSPRNILVIAQVSLSLVALISAGLLMRSFQNTLDIDPGFRTEDVLTVSFNLNDNRYLEEAMGQDLVRRLREEVTSVPGVLNADVGSAMPMFFPGMGRTVFIEGRDAGEAEDGILVSTSTVGPKYLEAMGIELLRGRDFSRVEEKETSSDIGPDYAIINETMAERFWPGEDALGRHFRFYGDDHTVEVIGIAATTKYLQLAEQPQPFAYLPIQQSFRDMRFAVNLFVRTAGGPTSVAGDVRSVIRELDPNIPITSVLPMTEVVHRSMLLARIGAVLVAAFGGLALFLAAIGVYGVISFSVSQRTHEIGLRMALGARSADAMKLVVKQGLALTLIGIVIGVAVSIGITRVMATFLVGIDALDPTVFGGVALTLAAVSVLACYIPALRATKVDPVTALKFE